MVTRAVQLAPERFSFVKQAGYRHVHYAQTLELDPLCTCPCGSPNVRKLAGDTLCRCGCHQQGSRFTLALCGLRPDVKWITLTTPPKAPICQECHARACSWQVEGPPAPPPKPVPPPVCSATCSYLQGMACTREPTHVGLHSAPLGGSGKKVSW